MQKVILRHRLVSLLMLSYFYNNMANSCHEHYSITSAKQYHEISSHKDGDYIIKSIQSVSDGGDCKHVTIDGLLRIYAVKFAVQTINEDKKRLKNVKLGYEINDACLSLPIAMSWGINLINGYRQNQCVAQNKDKCSSTDLVSKPPIAVVGAYYSFNTLPLASLLSLYNIPQISFSSSSPLLDKTDLYTSFFRTIPPDTFQVKALVDILYKFNWTYVFAVGSDDDYGKLGISKLKNESSARGICITGDLYIPFEAARTRAIAQDIVTKIEREPKAKVVVMFNYPKGNAEFVLKAADERNISRIWLTSEAWNPEVFSTDISTYQLQGIVTVSLKNGKPLSDFEGFIKETVATRTPCDGWLSQYILNTHSCNITTVDNNTLRGVSCTQQACKACSVSTETVYNAILKENPSQINNLIDAVDAIGYALDDVINKSSTSPITPEALTNAMKKVNFKTRREQTFAFDEIGNPAYVSYSIEQIQIDSETNNVAYVTIGNWTHGKGLSLNYSRLRWPTWTKMQPQSTCSTTCQPGEYVVGKRGCCWECRSCEESTVSNQTNAEKCVKCQDFEHAVANKECVTTPILHLRPGEAIGLTTAILSILGIILTVVSIMALLQRSDVVKKSPFAMIVPTFLLLLTTFSYTILHLVPPKPGLCTLQNAYFHMVMILYSALLLVKSDSVARFVSKHATHKENTRITRLLLFALLLVIQAFLILAWLLTDGNNIEKIFNKNEYFQKCVIKFTWLRITVFAFPCIILLIAFIQSMSEQHNHRNQVGKYIYFTCFSLCIINSGYIITVNYVVGEYQAMVTLLTIISYGFVYLTCMVLTTLFKAITTPQSRQPVGILNIGYETNASDHTEMKNPDTSETVPSNKKPITKLDDRVDRNNDQAQTKEN
ncbi:extracellular calcium-sensing receptor-like isoform X3 [Hydractinia symbiolongicarpus]|nr:extracellular calcium-sensing receptor-like isoform X3 [Hydractinia symbiolongicarpus]